MEEMELQLPIETFQKYLMEKKIDYKSDQKLAEALGMSARRLGCILSGKDTSGRAMNTVHVDTVDRSAINLGEHLKDVYPELYQ